MKAHLGDLPTPSVSVGGGLGPPACPSVSVFAAAGVAVLHSDWRSGLLGGTGAWFEGSRGWQGAALAVGAWARAACASASFTSERGPRISF